MKSTREPQNQADLRITMAISAPAAMLAAAWLLGIGCTPPPGCNINSPPDALAGEDQTVAPGDTVVLDGTLSSDLNDDDLSFEWEQSRGPVDVSLETLIGPVTTFVPTIPGLYGFNLFVKDGCELLGRGSQDEVVIEVQEPCDSECDDGQFCNGIEQCSEGTCVAGASPCAIGEECNEAANTCEEPRGNPCASCDDGVFCNGIESCITGGVSIACLGGFPPCTAGERCDELANECVLSSAEDGGDPPLEPTVGITSATACDGVTRIKFVFGTDIEDLIDSIELGGEVVAEAELEPVPMRFTGPLSMAFVMDQSLSMETSDPGTVRFDAATTMFDLFEPNDESALLDFALTVRRLHDMTKDEDALVAATLALSGESTREYTAIFDGVIEGIAVIDQQATNSDRAVVLFTDGANNAGTVTQEDAIATALEAGVPVFTVGLTNAINPESLSRMAFETGGGYFAASDVTSLARSFTTIVELLQGHARTSSALFTGEYPGTRSLTIRLVDGRSIVLPDLLFVLPCSDEVVPPTPIACDDCGDIVTDWYALYSFLAAELPDPPDLSGDLSSCLSSGFDPPDISGVDVPGDTAEATCKFFAKDIELWSCGCCVNLFNSCCIDLSADDIDAITQLDALAFTWGGCPTVDVPSLPPSTAPAIRLTPTSLTFSATQGGTNPASKVIQLTNSSGGTLTWSVSDSAT